MSEQKPEQFLPSTLVDFDKRVPFGLKSQIQMALGEIDHMHRVCKRVRMMVTTSAKPSEQGSYDPRFLRIEVNRKAEGFLGTFIHEYGHFVDNRILHPLSNTYASQYDLDCDRLMEACLNSDPVIAI